jgi:hypothetical protein
MSGEALTKNQRDRSLLTAMHDWVRAATRPGHVRAQPQLRQLQFH